MNKSTIAIYKSSASVNCTNKYKDCKEYNINV